MVVMAVGVVVLDLGGVVCGFHPARRLAALAALTGRHAKEIDAAIWGSGLDAAAERGIYEPAAATAAVLEQLGPHVDPVDLRVAWAAAFEPDPRVLGLVAGVQRPTVLFTNNGPLLEDCLDHELAGVAAPFDQILLSWRIGATKPDPVAFERATGSLAVASPSDVLFVDDSLDNIEAATRHGWQAHHYQGPDHLSEVLASQDVLPES